MDFIGSNPFTVFTFIAAPAVMTNAVAVMSLTTSNRIARAVDRSRALVAELRDHTKECDPEIRNFQVREVGVARDRAMLLNRSLASFQFAFGSFAAATLLALLGAVFGHLDVLALVYSALLLVVGCMALGIGGIVRGALLIVREARMAYTILREESQYVLKSVILTVPPLTLPPPVSTPGE
jgi:hypothetical protein